MDNNREIRSSTQKTPSVSKGKNYLLAIGIDDYNHHRSLSNAVADASAFVEVMTTRYGFEHLTPPLYNKEATQRNIRKAFGKCESLYEHDRLIVFYSGHGWYKTRAKLGYLVPTEAEDDPNSDFIPINFITDIFRAVKAHHVLLVVDCCFGGSFGLERNVSVAMTEKKISILDTKKSRMVMSSGGIELVSDGLVDENNSPFTKPLIEILKENQAPQMAFSEFFNLLCKKTIWNANQIPQYKALQHLGHDDGELALYCTDLESPEERDYNKAIETENISLLEKFIRDYPTSEYKPVVRKLLTNRRAEQAWEKIKNSRHIEKFDEFIDEYPNHPLADLARQKIIDLEIADEEIEKQKRIAEDNTRKEKERLAQLERKKQEEATRKKEEAEQKERQKQSLIKQFEPEMVLVKGDTFNRESQKVTLSDFSIGKYPITQAEWQAVMGSNPSHFKGDNNCPVESVSWDDCQEFINKLNENKSKKYCLPTEAQWEFAARGGNQSKGYEYSGSNTLDKVAWYGVNSESKTHPVGTKKGNELGIHDMSGNVWEWCSDWHARYGSDAVNNPTGAKEGFTRVLRGGSWRDPVPDCRVANRSNFTPNNSFYILGFRLLLSP